MPETGCPDRRREALNILNQYAPTYNANGNMRTFDGWTYTWNAENRLFRAEKGTTKVEFAYDYLGRRIEKKVYSGNTLKTHLKFVYDGYKLVAELNGMNSNALVRRYTWNAGSTGLDTPLAVHDAGTNTTYFYRTDANKNVVALTTSTAVAAWYEYDPYGKVISSSGDFAETNPIRFSSEYADSETGLVYYNYRYYNPTIGRWLSKDPIAENGGVNLYNFVENNPVNAWDWLGQKDTMSRDDYWEYWKKQHPNRDIKNDNIREKTLNRGCVGITALNLGTSGMPLLNNCYTTIQQAIQRRDEMRDKCECLGKKPRRRCR